VGLSPPGTLENLPLLPIPVRLSFCRVMCVKDEALAFFTRSTVCIVCFLQEGQYVLKFFGIFILEHLVK
jgi:hypothetical protein